MSQRPASNTLVTGRDPLQIPRPQHTIAGQACVSGTGLFTNARVTATFLPAKEDSGIVFERVDLPGSPRIPANVAHLIATPRRTSIAAGPARVEMIEHTMAALAGLGIDNCLVQVDGPEMPGLDGSSKPTVDALLSATVISQARRVQTLRITQPIEVTDGRGGTIAAYPSLGRAELDLTYLLDHPHPRVGRQSAHFTVTPRTFLQQVAAARTFVLMDEVAALKATGYGRDLTEADLCVFDDTGIVGNTLRFENEPARHKLLDCIGDFFLAGQPVEGRIVATKSGHALNQQFIQTLVQNQAGQTRQAA